MICWNIYVTPKIWLSQKYKYSMNINFVNKIALWFINYYQNNSDDILPIIYWFRKYLDVLHELKKIKFN